MNDPRNPGSEEKRKQLIREAILGFLGFFWFLSLVQAVMNVLRPEPAVGPALLALVLTVVLVAFWRATR